MKIGISTASLFLDLPTEEATKYLSEHGVKTSEAFLTAFSEYSEDFAKLLAKNKGNMNFNSVHSLTTQYEPQLYSKNERAYNDAYAVLEKVLKAGQTIGAKNYTFHGFARIKRTPIKIDYDVCGDFTRKISEKCAEYGINLAYENVHWCYYNYIGFFSEMKKRCPLLKGTLDIKQARQSGVNYAEFIDEMAEDIVTVHVSDINENGKMCLPLMNGTVDYDDLFSRLVDVGFDGAVLIEAYREDYKNRLELLDSMNALSEKASKYFKTVE